MDSTYVIVIAACVSVILMNRSCCPQLMPTITSAPEIVCFLPEPPQFGHYISPICKYNYISECAGHPGSPVPENWVLSFTCNEGYSLEDRQDSALVFCANGKWYPNIPTCQKLCGKKHPYPTRTEYPWHVSLYRTLPYYLFSKEWRQYCLGTLISPHIVLTSANCVDSEYLNRVTSASDVKVAVGKRNLIWDRDEPDSVKSDVREIAVPPHYLGEVTKYAHNIALLNLEKSVNVSSIIMPACFEWNNASTILPGARGMVIGWNFTAGERAFNTVSDSCLTFIDYKKCVFQTPFVHNGLVLPEKLCAEYRDGPLLTNRHEGAGLTFVINGAHYVLGVVSSIVSQKTDLTNITLFTNVSNCQLRNWITETIQRFTVN